MTITYPARITSSDTVLLPQNQNDNFSSRFAEIQPQQGIKPVLTTTASDLRLPLAPQNAEDRKVLISHVTTLINTGIEMLPRFNNTLFAQPNEKFCHTNESGVAHTRQILKDWSSNSDISNATIHLGVGSVVNYGMALDAKADYLLIVDLDYRVVAFHEYLISKIEHLDTSNAEDIGKIQSWLEHNSGRRSSADKADINWTTQDNMAHLQSMIKEGRVHCVQANITDAMQLIQNIRQNYRNHEITPPKMVLYTSNVGDWIAGRNTNETNSQKIMNNFKQFRQQANNLVGQEGCVVYSTSQLKDSRGFYIQSTALQGKGMLSFDNAIRRGFAGY